MEGELPALEEGGLEWPGRKEVKLMPGQGRKSQVLVPVGAVCHGALQEAVPVGTREAGDPQPGLGTPRTRLCPSGSHSLLLLTSPAVPSPLSLQGWHQGSLQEGPAEGTDGTTCP